MGTTKPLKIAVHECLIGSPEVQALIEKGHKVDEYTHMSMYDVILAPNAWRMTPELLPYLDLSIKQARALRYPPKEKA